jgi:hypothetical protein
MTRWKVLPRDQCQGKNYNNIVILPFLPWHWSLGRTFHRVIITLSKTWRAMSIKVSNSSFFPPRGLIPSNQMCVLSGNTPLCLEISGGTKKEEFIGILLELKSTGMISLQFRRRCGRAVRLLLSKSAVLPHTFKPNVCFEWQHPPMP